MADPIARAQAGTTDVMTTPLIAIGRALDDAAAARLTTIFIARLVEAVVAFLTVVASAVSELPSRVEIAVAVLVASAECVVQFYMLPRAMGLHSLGREIMRHEMLLSAGFGRDDSASLALRTRAASAYPRVAGKAAGWLKHRQGEGLRLDGSDYHTTATGEPGVRLLDILYENFCWWREISAAVAAVYFAPVVVLTSLCVVSIALVAIFADRLGGTNVVIVTVLLQVFLALISLNAAQDWQKWRESAAVFERRCAELSRTLHPKDGPTLMSYVLDYAVLTASLPPVPRMIFRRLSPSLDSRITAELRAREQERTGR